MMQKVFVTTIFASFSCSNAITKKSNFAGLLQDTSALDAVAMRAGLNYKAGSATTCGPSEERHSYCV